MGRDKASIMSKISQLCHEGLEGYAVGIDVTDGQSVALAFHEVDKLNKPICGLIYNAVARRVKRSSELLPEDIGRYESLFIWGDKVYFGNITAVYRL